MERWFDINTLREILVRDTSAIVAAVSRYLPHLLLALGAAVSGWVLARLAAGIVGRSLRMLGVDRPAARLNLESFLARAGIHRSTSSVIGRLIFWVVMLPFVLAAVQILGLPGVNAAVDRVVDYLPTIVDAALTLFIGLLLARVIGTSLGSGAAAAGLPHAARLGFVSRWFLSALVLVVAVEQLGVAIELLVAPLTAGIAAVGFGAGLAFGIGASPVVTHILAGHFLKQSLPRDRTVVVGGRRAVIARVGSTETLLRDGDQSWTIPNARLLNLDIER